MKYLIVGDFPFVRDRHNVKFNFLFLNNWIRKKLYEIVRYVSLESAQFVMLSMLLWCEGDLGLRRYSLSTVQHNNLTIPLPVLLIRIMSQWTDENWIKSNELSDPLNKDEQLGIIYLLDQIDSSDFFTIIAVGCFCGLLMIFLKSFFFA
jgi:hypothetical protein